MGRGNQPNEHSVIYVIDARSNLILARRHGELAKSSVVDRCGVFRSAALSKRLSRVNISRSGWLLKVVF
jgi:hypothetical protein